MKHLIRTATLAAMLAGLAGPPAWAGPEPAGPTTKETEQARDELKRARDELKRAAEEFARATAKLGKDSPMAFAYQYMANPNRAVLGVSVNIDGDDGEADRGIRVLAVTPGSGADKAGLKAGDLLVSVNGKSLAMPQGVRVNKTLHDFMANVNVGDEVQIEYERGGRRTAVTAVAGRPEPSTKAGMWGEDWERDLEQEIGRELGMLMPPGPPGCPQDRLGPRRDIGVQLAALDDDLGRYFHTRTGVLVVRAPRSGALNLRSGDVIQKIDGKDVGDPISVMERLLEARDGNIRLDVLRQGRTVSVQGAYPMAPRSDDSKSR